MMDYAVVIVLTSNALAVISFMYLFVRTVLEGDFPKHSKWVYSSIVVSQVLILATIVYNWVSV